MEDGWQPRVLDLFLAGGIAVLFPFVSGLLFTATGALIPMILYYGMAWGIVKWRRGSTGYFNPIKTKLPVSFLVNTGLILLALVFAYQARVLSMSIQHR